MRSINNVQPEMITIFSFLLVLTVVVFVHEFGHFYTARKCGVRVEEFSIGFGKTLIQKSDKNGTIWKMCLLPFGGYVKMMGDKDASSFGSLPSANPTEEELKHSILHKTKLQKIMIALAGPLANYIFGFVIFSGLFYTIGIMHAEPIITQIEAGSPAANIGLQPQDEIISINDNKVHSFKDVQRVVALHTGGTIQIIAKRGGEEKNFTLLPKITLENNGHNQYKIGIMGPESTRIKLNIYESASKSIGEIYAISSTSLQAMGQIIMGKRTPKDLSGPVRIIKYAGEAGQKGLIPLISFIGFLSISLGLINLLPIPLLDGGHVVVYTIEQLIGKDLNKRAYQLLYTIGIGFVGVVTVYALLNDISSLLTK